MKIIQILYLQLLYIVLLTQVGLQPVEQSVVTETSLIHFEKHVSAKKPFLHLPTEVKFCLILKQHTLNIWINFRSRSSLSFPASKPILSECGNNVITH